MWPSGWADPIGISSLATFLQVRERVHFEQVMQTVGLATDALDSVRGDAARSTVTLPASIREPLASASTAGFHDLIALLVVLAAFGTAAAFLLQSGRR